MINKLSIENFKSIRHLSDLDIKPVTILCGTNSCGKSSLLKSFLLFKQTLDYANINEGAIFNGDYVRLGNFLNTVWEKNKENELTLEFSSSRFTHPVMYGAELNSFLGEPDQRLGRNSISIKLSITIGLDAQSDSKNSKTFVKEYCSKVISEKNTTSVKITSDKNKRRHLVTENLHLSRRRRFLRDQTNSQMPIDMDIPIERVHFAGLLPDVSFLFDFQEEDRHKVFSALDFINITNRFWREISKEIRYIGPLREEPSRRYIYENIYTDIGVKGENAAFLLINEAKKTIGNFYFYSEDENRFVNQRRILLKDAVATWMDSLGIHGFNASAYESDIVRVTLNDNNTSMPINMADVGFGISQVFPIILEGIRMPSESTLLLEQPEIHLHPSLQAKIADFFIALALSNRNVIVETHSDNIVNRLVRRIVEDESGDLSKLVQIYFVSPSSEGAQFESIKIDEMSGIINWPKGFLDTTVDDQTMILKAGINKRRGRKDKGVQ